MTDLLNKQTTLYLRDFDEHEKVVITYSQEDLETAQKEGFDQGFNDGYATGYAQGQQDALNEHDHTLQKTLHTVQNDLEQYRELQTQYNENLEFHIITTLRTILKKVLPFYIKEYGFHELHQFCEQTLDHLIRKETVILFTHSTFYDFLLKKSPQFLNQIKVEMDETLHPYECRLEFVDGGAHYHLEEITQKVFDVIDQIPLLTQAETQQQTQEISHG